MRTLVTGATGYLGLHLVHALLGAGHDVTTLVRSPARLGPLAGHRRLTVVEGSLEEIPRIAAALAGHDACVHAAILWGDPGTDWELRDTAAAAQLFDAAGRTGLSRLLFLSSTAVHRPFRAGMSESDRLTTADCYGATKAAGELFLWAACATHGLAGLVVRPGPIVGPPAFEGGAFKSDNRLAALVDCARRGEPLHVLRGDGRQFVAATDVARVVVTLLESPRSQETYLCCSREGTTWESLARTVIEQTGSASEIVIEEPAPSYVVPVFDTGKLQRDLGLELDARAALEAHIAYLAKTSKNGSVG